MQCSYVVTDPKGTVLEEVGTMLARGAWELDDKGNKVPKVGKNGQVLKTKSGKVIYKRIEKRSISQTKISLKKGGQNRG